MTQKSGELKEILIDRQQIRRLTPTECERLQGFPDGWTEGVSDTQRYKTLGNAVTTNVVQAIAEKLFENIARDIEEGKQSALLEEGVKTKC